MANAAQPKPKQRPHASAITPEYAKAHRVGITNVAKAADMTPEAFLAASVSKRHGVFDVREQRPLTAKVFAHVPESEWPETRDVFCFVIGRRPPLAERLRAEGK